MVHGPVWLETNHREGAIQKGLMFLRCGSCRPSMENLSDLLLDDFIISSGLEMYEPV